MPFRSEKVFGLWISNQCETFNRCYRHIYVHVPGAYGFPKNIFDKIKIVSNLESFIGSGLYRMVVLCI